MISIIISACLISNPTVCKDYRVPLASNIDAKGCLFRAQPHLPRWAEQHPHDQALALRFGRLSGSLSEPTHR